MFAYCNNNAVNLVDFGGSIPRELPGIFPYTDGGSFGLGGFYPSFVPSNYDLGGPTYSNDSPEISYQSNDMGSGAQILNSYTIKNPITMYKYIQENRGEEIVGSTTGVVFEWVLHNIAYEVGNFALGIGVEKIGKELKDRGETLDVGRTIYDDDHGMFSVIMWASYMVVHPQHAGYDLAVHIRE